MTGDRCHASARELLQFVQSNVVSLANMTMYKVKYLLSTLPNALAYGAAEIVPHMEPLKVMNSVRTRLG
jgi:hypothetical protein